MKMFLPVILLLSLFAASSQAQDSQADSSSWELWRKAFLNYEKGEQAQTAGDVAKALQHFKEAHDSFWELKRTNPEWNAKVIEYRIGVCEKKIDALKASGAAAPSGQKEKKQPSKSPDKTESSQSHQSKADEKSSAMAQELAQYKEKLFKAVVDLEAAKREAERNSKAVEDIKAFVREKEELVKQNEALQKRLDEAKAAGPNSAELEKKLVAEKIRADKFEQEIKKLSEEGAKSGAQVKDLQLEKNAFATEAKNLREKLKQQEAQAELLQKREQENSKAAREQDKALASAKSEIERLSQKLDEKNRELAAANSKLSSLRGDMNLSAAARQIDAENEVLKKNGEAMQMRLEQLSSDNSRLAESGNNLKNELTAVKSALASLTKQRDDLAKELASAKSKLLETAATLDKRDAELKNSSSSNLKLKTDLKTFADKIESSSGGQSALGILSKENEELKEKEKELNAAVGALKGENEALKTRMDELSRQLKSPPPPTTNGVGRAQDKDAAAAPESDGKDADSLLKGAESAEAKGDIPAAASLYESALKLSPNPVLSKKLCALLLRQKNFLKAAQIAESAAAKNDKDISALFLLTRATLGLKNTAKAEDALARAAKIEPENAELCLLRGLLAEQKGVPADAEKFYRKSLDLNGDNTEALTSLAKILVSSGKGIQEAEKIYELLLQKGCEPDPALAAFFPNVKKGDAKPQKSAMFPEKKLDSLIDSQLKIIDLGLGSENIDEDVFLFLLGESSKADKNNDKQSAKWYLDKASAYVKDKKNADKLMGLAFGKIGNPLRTMEFLEKANRQSPNDPAIMVPLASSYIKFGKTAEAVELLNVAVLLAPKNPELFLILGLACQNAGRPDIAEKNMRRAIELKPDYGDAYHELARHLAASSKTRWLEVDALYKKARECGVAEDPVLDRLLKMNCKEGQQQKPEAAKAPPAAAKTAEEQKAAPAKPAEGAKR